MEASFWLGDARPNSGCLFEKLRNKGNLLVA
jgi:hypothetical protein